MRWNHQKDFADSTWIVSFFKELKECCQNKKEFLNWFWGARQYALIRNVESGPFSLSVTHCLTLELTSCLILFSTVTALSHLEPHVCKYWLWVAFHFIILTPLASSGHCNATVVLWSPPMMLLAKPRSLCCVSICIYLFFWHHCSFIARLRKFYSVSPVSYLLVILEFLLLQFFFFVFCFSWWLLLVMQTAQSAFTPSEHVPTAQALLK